MFSPSRGVSGDTAWGSCQVHRLSDQPGFAEGQGFSLLGNAQMLNLGILKHFIDLVNRSTRYFLFFKKLNPFTAGFLEGHFFDFLIQQVTIFGTRWTVNEFWIFQPFRFSKGFRKAYPNPFSCHREVDCPVCGFKHPGGNAGGMIVPGLPWNFSCTKPTCCLKV